MKRISSFLFITVIVCLAALLQSFTVLGASSLSTEPNVMDNARLLRRGDEDENDTEAETAVDTSNQDVDTEGTEDEEVVTDQNDPS